MRGKPHDTRENAEKDNHEIQPVKARTFPEIEKSGNGKGKPGFPGGIGIPATKLKSNFLRDNFNDGRRNEYSRFRRH
jgi:hypothetical protein